MSNELNLSKNAIAVLEKRYLEPGETPMDMFKRVAGGNEDFLKIMTDLDFLPNSPTLMNAGTGKKGTLSACFHFCVADEMFGSNDSIMSVACKAAAVAKWGGGVGYYLGDLRPKNSLIQSVHRKACGPVRVLKFYNEIGKLITQGGRRELAQISILPSYSQDIREFIHCKDKDPQSLSTFNISVSCDDKFMKKSLEKDSEESKLWQEICESAWKTGDPGLYFFDTAERANPTPHLGQLKGTNPCLTSEVLVSTADGRNAVSIKQLAEEGKDVPVYCVDNDNKLAIRMMRHPRVTGYNQPIYKLTLDDGYTIRTTGNHKFRLRDGSWKEIINLVPGDSLSIMTKYVPNTVEVDSEASRFYRYVSIQLSPQREPYYEHRLIAGFVSGRQLTGNDHVHHKDSNRFNNCPDNLEIKSCIEHLSEHSAGEENPRFSGVSNEQLLVAGRKLTKSLGRRFSREEWRVFARDNELPTQFSKYRLKSLGTILTFSKNCAVLENVEGFSNVDPRVVRNYQELLSSGLDASIIDGKVYITRACENCNKPFVTFSYRKEVSYCSIACSNSKRDNTEAVKSIKATFEKKKEKIREQQLEIFTKLKNTLGRVPQKKEWINACKASSISGEISRKSSPFTSWTDLTTAASAFNHRVVSIELDGYEDVYNGTVDDFHNFFVGGWQGSTSSGVSKFTWILNANCGEVPLLSNEPCNLGSINLSNFVIGNKKVDYARLSDVVSTATRFLDYILDINTFPHEDITKAAYATRKLGLGIMGWADMLALLGIHYDTEEAVTFAEAIMQLINTAASNTSKTLGKEKGPYPAARNDDHRNATRTCLAPCGSIAIIAGCSSSAEPHYAIEWDRTMGDGTVLKERIPVYDRLDGFVPKTANEVNWKWHIKHQAAFQKYTNLACSKSVNLPNSATVEDISSAYRMAYDLGCKGTTIFRDGCREGGEQVLVAKKSTVKVEADLTKDKLTGHNQVKENLNDELRPEYDLKELKRVPAGKVRYRLPDERPAINHKFSISGVEGYLTVGVYESGLLAGLPGEIFVNVSKEGSTVSGLIDCWAISTSMALQSGTSIDDLVRKFAGTRFEPFGMTSNKDIPTATSIPDYIVRWLQKRFMTDKDAKNVTIGSGMICPECHAMAAYHGGCLICSKQCGWAGRCG